MPKRKNNSKKGKKAKKEAPPAKVEVKEVPAPVEVTEPEPPVAVEPVVQTEAQEGPEETTVVLEDGGVIKEILVPGSGPTPPPGVDVKVHYVGTLLDGTKFDSSRDRDDFFVFPIGKGKVIKAWDLGVATMKRGEKSILTCKPEYAYGERGSPPTIPANATLKFEVELFDWEVKKENICTGVDKLVMTAGEGFPKPDDTSIVTMSFQGRLGDEDGEIFVDQSEPLELHMDNTDLSEGFVEAVKSLSQGEKAKIFIKAHMAEGTKDAPANTDLFYTMEVVELKNGTALWQMDTSQKFDAATKLKGFGNTFYGRGQHARAIRKYTKALDAIQHEKDAGDLQEGIDSLKVSCYSNMTACNMKQQDYETAIENATKALEVDANHVKSLFRRGEANMRSGLEDAARQDFKALIAVDPSNKPGKTYLAALEKKLAKAKAKERSLYKNMFSRVSLADAPNGGYTQEKKAPMIPDSSDEDSDDDEPPALEEDTSEPAPAAAPAVEVAAPAPAVEETKEKPVQQQQNQPKQKQKQQQKKQSNKKNKNQQQSNQPAENPWAGVPECYLASVQKQK